MHIPVKTLLIGFALLALHATSAFGGSSDLDVSGMSEEFPLSLKHGFTTKGGGMEIAPFESADGESHKEALNLPRFWSIY